MEGTPPLTGRALPNLINAVKMFKVKVKNRACFDFDVDFKILTAFIRLGRARPEGAGCPPYYNLILTLTLVRAAGLAAPDKQNLILII
jgi:hypothetical protein